VQALDGFCIGRRAREKWYCDVKGSLLEWMRVKEG
jgi:hypothetical protein